MSEKNLEKLIINHFVVTNSLLCMWGMTLYRKPTPIWLNLNYYNKNIEISWEFLFGLTTLTNVVVIFSQFRQIK